MTRREGILEFRENSIAKTILKIQWSREGREKSNAETFQRDFNIRRGWLKAKTSRFSSSTLLCIRIENIYNAPIFIISRK